MLFRSQCQAEQQIFGAKHTDVGGYLLGLWGLPVPVVEAIAFHHRPSSAAEKTFCPLTAVHAANALLHEAAGAGAMTPNPRLDTAYLTTLGLAARVPAWREALPKNTTSTQAA